MLYAALLVSALSAAANIGQGLAPGADPALTASGLAWACVFIVLLTDLVRCRLTGRLPSTSLLIGTSAAAVFGIALLETIFGTLLLVTLGAVLLLVLLLAFHPKRARLWKWGIAVGAVAVLLLRAALRPLDSSFDTTDLYLSSPTIGVALATIGVLLEQLLGSLRDSLHQSEQRRIALQQHQAALEASRDRALAASQAKAAFLSHMSHELRTPLNAILGYIELIAEEFSASAPVQDDLQRVQTAARHLLGTISNILDLSRIEAGETTVQLDPVEPDALVGRAIDTVRPLLAARGNTARLDVDAPPLRTDAQIATQVLVNLLSNAAKFTDGGVVTVRARAEVRAERAGVRFEVQDTGRGIAADDLERIFHSFQRVDASREGSGIGLSLSRALAERLGGVLSVHSELGVGSTFTLWLPDRVDAQSPGADGAVLSDQS